jgi:Xaa-Pro aminopeptidase
MFHFVPEEIAEKKRRVRALLDELSLDGVYFKKSANFAWLTGGGYNIVGLATELGVAGALVTRDRCWVVCSNIEAPRMEREERLAEQGYEIVSFPWYDDKEASLVVSLCGDKLGADYPFPGASDVSGTINPLRYSLTSWEVERYAEQARLTATAAEETASPSAPRRGAGGGRPALPETVVRGDGFHHRLLRRRRPHLPVPPPRGTDRKIRERAMISVNSRRRGLIVSITRFVQFGPLPADLRKRYEDNVYVDSAMMAATVPGRPASDAFRAALAAYAEKGYPEEYKLHHQGGAIGYIGRDYKATDRTTEIVRENQAFTWNPSITGVKSEDTMLATKNGPVVLSEPVLFPALTVEKGGFAFRRPAILEL